MTNDPNLVPAPQQKPLEQEPQIKPLWKIWQPIAVLLAANLLSLLPALVASASPSYNVVGVSLLSYLIQIAGFCLGPLYIVYVGYRQPAGALGIAKISSKQFRKAVLWGALLYILNVIISLFVVAIRGEEMALQSVLQLFDYATNPFELVALMVCIAVLAPLSEELLFRAFLYPPIKETLGKRSAVLFTAVIFASCHGSLWVFFPMLAGGIGFALLYDKYHSLPMNILAHMTWNIIALSLYFNI